MHVHLMPDQYATYLVRSCYRYTYEVAPVFVLMEEEVLCKLRSLIGWSEGDGIFCPGGSISNMYAMNVARYWAFPQVKTKGLWATPRMAVFTSRQVQRQELLILI